MTEEEVDLKKLPKEERERIMRLAAQRIEDRRNQKALAAKAARDPDEMDKQQYRNPKAKDTRVVFEEETQEVSSDSYSAVELVEADE